MRAPAAVDRLRNHRDNNKLQRRSPSDLFRKTVLIPNKLELDWQHLTMPPNRIKNWLDAAATTSAGRTKRAYPETVVYGVSKLEMDTHQEEHGGVHAVAYAIGRELMLGTAHDPDQEIFSMSNDMRFYVVTKQIGQRAIRLSAGLFMPNEEYWTPLEPLKFIGRPPLVMAPDHDRVL